MCLVHHRHLETWSASRQFHQQPRHEPDHAFARHKLCRRFAGRTDTITTVPNAIMGGSACGSTFVRAYIVNDGPTFARSDSRSDWIASPGVCTHTEELANFANWYA